MKKPTIEQMKKKPSLWVDFDDYLIIVYPDGSNEYMYDYDWLWSKGIKTPSWGWVRRTMKFVSWL